MSARVTRKRARMDAEQAEEDGASASTSSASGHGDSQARPGNFEQDPELWFQDGSIILVAGEIAFKVYKGPLVNQSPVFSDMLSLPQPSLDVHQDCPIVQLLDSPEDMRHFLRTLMPSKHPRFASAPRMSFHAVYACARLGHKYQIDHLVAESLEWFSMFYPSDVDKFSKYRDRHQLPSCAIAMVTLARLTGADQLLPVALAECCELGADVVNGFEREDGTRDDLAPEDLGRCITATRNLVEARLHAMEHTVHPAVYEGCEEGCIHDINMFRDRVLCGTIPGLCTTQFWRSYASLLTDEFPDVCKRCAEEFSEEELVQQRSIFRRLSELVGVAVDGWGKKPRSTRHGAQEG